MDKKDIKKIKKNIIKCLTEPDENGKVLMHREEYYSRNHDVEYGGYTTYDTITLKTLMDYIVKGLYMSLDDKE